MQAAGEGGLTRRSVVAGGIAAGVSMAAGLGADAQSPAPASAGAAPGNAGLPLAPRDGTVDVLHGVSIADPYRPLENMERPDVKTWIAAQDARARSFLDALPVRTQLHDFISAAMAYSRTTIPGQFGPRYFTMFSEGLADQRSLGVQEHLGGPRKTLIDAATLSADGTVTIASAVPDRRGTKVAYLLSEAGSDQQTLHVRDVETGQDLPDVLKWCKHTTIAWARDGHSFFYSRYPGDNDPQDWYRRGQIVCEHKLGEPQSADRIIFRREDARDYYFELRATFDSDWLKIIAGVGTSEKRGYFIAPLHAPTHFTEIFPIGTAGFNPMADTGGTHYALTNLGAPKWRLVRIDISDPKPERWHTVIAESDAVLDQAAVFNRWIVAKHLDNVNHRISMYDLAGQRQSSVDLGSLASVTFGRSFKGDDHQLLGVTDYKQPTRIEWLDLESGKTSLFHASPAKHDLSDAVVRQVFVDTKDGAKVPMTLIHLPGIQLDGNNRTLLTAYGGFGISLWPYYSEQITAWVRMGGVFALASIRGGGEYGQAWHDAARREHRQTAFDDFIAAAEWLIANNYTRHERLGITGTSNGGLLVLATMLQRPDLFGAVVSAVPVTDMLRFAKFTFGVNWRPEYGDPEKNEADFKALLAYSPLHNVRKGASYPPLLVLTADHDDRVAPLHSYKFVATMQEQVPDSTLYLRIEQRAGHGQGNALRKTIDRNCDTLAFLCDKLGGSIKELPKLDRV